MALASFKSNAESNCRMSARAAVDDLRSAVFWRDVIAETLAVTVLMTMIVLVVIGNNPIHVVTTTHLGLFGVIVVYLLIEGYGPISGAHLNPAASLSLFIAGKVSLARALLYIIAQIAGTAAGSGLGYLMTPENKRSSFPVFDPEHNGLTVCQGVLIEAFFTFNLIFVALSVHDTVNRSPIAVMPSLPIACCVAVGLISAGTHSGGLMNPIISLGPAILMNTFKNHWVYWVGPLIGGPLAVPVYKVFIVIKIKYGGKLAAVADSPVDAESKLLNNQALQYELIHLLEKLTAVKQDSSV